jgi:hypothetical protein
MSAEHITRAWSAAGPLRAGSAFHLTGHVRACEHRHRRWDWNLKYKGSPNAQDCVPGGFYRKGDGSLQHVIASDDFTFLETVVIDMKGTTDHPGLEVRLNFP